VSRRFHRLRVAETNPEIGGQALSIVFDVPAELSELFRWRAGQHLTLRFLIDGSEQRRSYTISASPHAGDPLRITVKRVRDGVVSNFLNDHMAAGSEIDVMPPFGGFILEPGPVQRRTFYFFGAGSGITPLYAMLRSVLVAEPYSVAHLLYGNRDRESILFRDSLSELREQHPERLTVSHVLSSPGWMALGDELWRRGRLDADAIRAFIDENPPVAQDVHYYICGPGGMNASLKQILQNIDVPAERIHFESFGGAALEPDHSVQGLAANATMQLAGERSTFPVAANQTLLEAARAAGLEPPYSCQSGVCGACAAQLVEGEVHMRVCAALDEREVARGRILTCQAVARSDEIEFSFD